VEYYGSKELAAAYRTVRRNTLTIAEEIPEARYDFRATPDTRSVGEMLAHIALSSSFPNHIHGNKITDLSVVNFPELSQRLRAEEGKPRNKTEILALLTSEGEKFASYLEKLPETFLAEQVKMAPGMEPSTKTRFEMLLGAKEHEMHHRGQLMLMERMIGIVPHMTRRMQERMAQRQQPQAAR
jgi:uncharacterized damage-inducible protein DinB